MPIVAHNRLPTFDRLSQQGLTILSPDRAQHQDIRELHIGLLNMMPDAALEVTERQFFGLLSGSNHIAQFYVHPFTLPEIVRGNAERQHIASYYDDFHELKERGLDALIISGANVAEADLSQEVFWEPLIEVVEWASEHVTSMWCSCLSSHAVLDFRYGLRRQRQAKKVWGVSSHQVVDSLHPLVKDINNRFDVPHSRWNAVTDEQFASAELPLLVQSEQTGVLLATSHDGFRCIFCQGHPEFDTVSLLKEYKREVILFFQGDRDSYPPLVENIFNDFCKAVLIEYQERVVHARHQGIGIPDFPDKLITPWLDNTWRDTGSAIMSKWIGLVYQLTNRDRAKPFMDGVNPDNPLGLV